MGIVICGVIGGVTAWALVTSFGLAGVPGALAAALMGTVIAAALWVGATTLWRTLARRR